MRGDVHLSVEKGKIMLYRTTRSAKGQKRAVRGSQGEVDLASETLRADLIEYLEKKGPKR